MTSTCEVWRDIPGYEGRYQASNLGRVRNTERLNLPGAGVLRPFVNCNGYHIAVLQMHGRKTRTGVHRLVALTFLPNPENKPQINHINGNKDDNRPDNLEWVTCSENNLHRRRVLNGGGGRAPRAVMCTNTGRTYPSITEAAKATHASAEKIVLCCQGKRKHTLGLGWAYAEEAAR